LKLSAPLFALIDPMERACETPEMFRHSRHLVTHHADTVNWNLDGLPSTGYLERPGLKDWLQVPL